jgi:hypothetical protein
MSAKNRPEKVAKLTRAHRAYRDAIRDDSVSDAELRRRSNEYDDVLCETTKNEWRSSNARLRREGS